MLEKYRPALGQLSGDACEALISRFHLPSDFPLYEALEARRIYQADVVIELLRMCFVTEAELLVGQPITRFPPRKVLPYAPCRSRKPTQDDLVKVLSVVPNPRLPTTDSFQRFRVFRPGLTVTQLLRRGVTRKDIREAKANEWVTFSEVRV